MEDGSEVLQHESLPAQRALSLVHPRFRYALPTEHVPAKKKRAALYHVDIK